jgi:hypothetical protein
VQYLAYGAKEYLLDGGEANKGIIEQTLEGMARMGLTSNQWTIMDRNLDQVAICFKRCYDDYTKYRRDHAIMGECLEYTQFLRQLRASDLFIAYKSVRMAGDTVSAHVLNFDLIRTRCGIQSFDVNAPDFDCPWD